MRIIVHNNTWYKGRHAWKGWIGMKKVFIDGSAGTTGLRIVQRLEARGVSCTFEKNPGGHFTDISGRLAKALAAVDG